MYVCGSANNGMHMASYESSDCSGDPYTIQSVQDYHNEISLRSNAIYSNVTETCCSNKYCDYASIKDYDTSSCSDSTTSGVSWSPWQPLIIGACTGEIGKLQKYISCNNEIASYNAYKNTNNCDGDPYLNWQQSNYCDNSTGSQQSVSCLTAINTCNITLPTGAPTRATAVPTGASTAASTGASTGAPTGVPTGVPTGAPIDADNPNDGQKYNIVGAMTVIMGIVSYASM